MSAWDILHSKEVRTVVIPMVCKYVDEILVIKRFEDM